LLGASLSMASRIPFLHFPSLRVSPPPLFRSRRIAGLAVLAAILMVAGCDNGSNVDRQRIDQLELKIQQLEQRLNKPGTLQSDPADKAGKPPAGPVKSLTFRTGTEDDRLRIYWADGTSTDLPCNQEQATYICG